MPTQTITHTADTISPTPLNNPSPSSIYPHFPPTTSIAPVIDKTSPDSEGYKFQDQVIEFEDESRWLISEPLSKMALQQTCSPCEARQVFTAIRSADPHGYYGDIEEAVIKVKFQ
jgi:hypothetical protein